jgi:hypothetical protein
LGEIYASYPTLPNAVENVAPSAKAHAKSVADADSPGDAAHAALNVANTAIDEVLPDLTAVSGKDKGQAEDVGKQVEESIPHEELAHPLGKAARAAAEAVEHKSADRTQKAFGAPKTAS